MNRRDFLKRASVALAGAVAFDLDPDRLLWVPGRKTFFLPPERSVVTATQADLAALQASFGLFMTGGTPRHPEYGVLNPAAAIRMLSDEEYRLLVARGHQILDHRRQIVLAKGDV